MKLFKQFCEDANIQELFGFNIPFTSPPKPPTTVLAYKNYQSGVLDKDKNKFTPKTFTPKEKQRYGWTPVKASSYSPGDAFTPNKVTATGEPHNWTTMNAAVPFKYSQGQAPSSNLIGKPSIPYGSTLNLTAAPMGRDTKITRAKINDVGDFGPTGHVNKGVSYDVSPSVARSVMGDRSTPNSQISAKWGIQPVYTKVTPPSSSTQKTKKP